MKPCRGVFYPLRHQPHKMVKHTQTYSVFDHFVGLVVNGLTTPHSRWLVNRIKFLYMLTAIAVLEGLRIPLREHSWEIIQHTVYIFKIA